MRKNDSNKHDDLELTIAHLTQHIETLRDAVPVNYELKAKLKKRLLEQLKQKQAEQRQNRPKLMVNKQKLIVMFSLFSVVLILLSYFFWPQDSLKISRINQLGTFSTEGISSSNPMTISADGQHVVLEQFGSLILVNVTGERSTLLKPRTGVFHSPAWSHHGDLLAVIYETEQESQIWVLQKSLQFASRSIYSGEGVTFSALAWSPDDQWVLAEDSSILTEGIQVHHDGSQAKRSSLEHKTEQDWREILERIKWPKAWRDKLASASRLWVDWNGNRTALVVGLQMEGEEQGEMVLIQLKQEVRGEETSEKNP